MNANQEIAARLRTVRRDTGWWIIGDDQDCGPYRTKAEADEDRQGLKRFYRHGHKRHYVSIDSGRRKSQVTQ